MPSCTGAFILGRREAIHSLGRINSLFVVYIVKNFGIGYTENIL